MADGKLSAVAVGFIFFKVRMHGVAFAFNIFHISAHAFFNGCVLKNKAKAVKHKVNMWDTG